MTKSTITRARMQEMLEWCEVFRRHPRLDDIAEAIRMALAGMDSEPVFTLEVSQADYKGQKLGNHFGFITLDASFSIATLESLLRAMIAKFFLMFLPELSYCTISIID